jgi:protein-S-isoprenylcysteine O-methyltransferase Ste14
VRKPAAAFASVLWFVGVGGIFGCLLPYLLNYWQFRSPLPYWDIARAIGALLICVGLVPLVRSFVDFFRAGGTPIPVASPPRLVVNGFYAHVRNPIYVGYLVVLIGQVLLFGTLGLLIYTAITWCVGAAAVRFYEEPRLASKFGAEYEAYRRAVPAWRVRLHPWTPGSVKVAPPEGRQPDSRQAQSDQ